jgi:hypothetical protein
MIFRQSDLDDEAAGRRINCAAVAHVFVGGTRNKGDWHVANQTDECAYNARLIAAAPDLLEALEAYVLAVEEDRELEDNDLHVKCRAAIAKAKGQQS